MEKKFSVNIGFLVSTTAIMILLVLLPFDVGAIAMPRMQSASGDREVAELLAVLRDAGIRQSGPDQLVKAIERLGEIKAVAAIDDLAQFLTFSRIIEQNKVGDVVVGEHFITLFGRYPAAAAMFQIGKSSLPALIKVIETKEIKSLASENARYTVNMIFRDTPQDGIDYIREAAANASSHQASQRLWVAAEQAEERAKKLRE